MTRTTVSPSSSTTSRSTPCVAGCCGPRLISMCSPLAPESLSRSGSGDAPQCVQSTDSNAEHFVDCSLLPFGAPLQRYDRVYRQVATRLELDLYPQVRAPLEGAQVVDQLERPLPVAVLHRGDVDEVIVL